MAINYPTSLDTFTNPTASSLLTSPSHSGLHTDINDAVEALEYKVGIGNTQLGAFIAHTPTFTNLTVGDGTLTGAYARVNDLVYYYGLITFGATTAITGSVSLGLPVNLHSTQIASAGPLGLLYMADASTGIWYAGNMNANASATSVVASTWAANGTYVSRGNLTAAIPFTWTTSDRIHWAITYRAA